MKNLKSCKGAITLYILVSILFFMIIIVNVYSNLRGKEDRIESEYQKIKENYEQNANEVYSKVMDDDKIEDLKKSQEIIKGDSIQLIDKKGDSIVIPKNFRLSLESPTLVTEGIIIEDSQANQYVWIPVFKKTTERDWGVDYSEVTSKTDYTNLEIALKNYTATYGIEYNYSDIWFGDANYGQYGYYAEDDIAKENLIYYTNGNMAEQEYNTLYHDMLTSIYINGGFYIGRYEMGIDLATSADDENDSTSAQSLTRISMSEYKLSKDNEKNTAPSINGMKIPISKENAVVYGAISQAQAQMLAEELGKDTDYSKVTSSILFGIQWDAVCVFIEKCDKNEKKLELENQSDWLTNNEYSKLWGNYNTSEFFLDRGFYTPDYTMTFLEKDTTKKAIGESWIYTTGAADCNQSLNIYDFAGNLKEWTLERNNNLKRVCVNRGDTFMSNLAAFDRGAHEVDYFDLVCTSRISFYITLN